jgi:uncharacterized membrane protein YdjX (TVP38/TMEM64 family)
MKLLKNVWVKLAIVLLFFVIVFVVLKVLGVDYSKISPENVKEKILSLGVWAPIGYIVFYTLRPLILFPAAVTSMVGGLAFGPTWGTLYTVIGATICAVVEFFIARIFGRGAVARFLKGKLVSVDEAIEKHGFITVLMIRLIPNAPYDVQNYSLGLTRVKARDYFLATFLGIIPGTFVFVYLGHSVSDPKQLWKIMIAALLFLGVYFLQKHLRAKHGHKIKTVSVDESGGETDERVSESPGDA